MIIQINLLILPMQMEKKQKYTGLTQAQVEESRRVNGVNILTPPEKDSLWKRFAQTLTGPFGHLVPGWEDGDMLVFILEIAAILSVCISLSEYNGWFGLPVTPDGAKVFFEPAGIIIAILLASGVGFLAEVKAEREFEVLNQVNDDEPVTVIRDGHVQQVPRRDVVVGDIIVLSTGEEIPADARLLEATRLNVDESTLTGEPMTGKSAFSDTVQSEDEVDTFPVYNVYKGTKVMEGHGVAEVFAVGDHTENGKVFTASKIDEGKKTPLNEQFDRLGILITTVSCIIGVLVLVGRVILSVNNMDVFSWPEFIAHLLQSVMIAVTLVVCAVPEGLPMAVTMALAYSMRRMLKTNNLVRKIHATETMGATTVICTDKTGTLTQNRMRVAEYCIAQERMQDVQRIMAVNSTAMLEDDGTPLGNPTEGALLLWLKDNGVDYRVLRSEAEVVTEEPFSTETKYMSSTLADGTVLFKGAPEIIMDMCGDFAVERGRAEEALKDYQQHAMRTLAFAMAEAGQQPVFLGVVGIMDPVREEVPESIQQCLRAGIKVKIVTGDAPETAREIYRQIFGNLPQCVVLGAAPTEELVKADIIARARPMDKKRLVEALQAEGEVVAVTGDGTNDAPALKTADVGLSMGDGTSVAKEASDITIIDNSFSSICRAVMWGRSLYINIQRFILFQLTVNITACLVVMIGSFMTTEAPLTVTQMLWVNLIMDTFAAIALASLPPSEAVMNKQPRNRKDNIIDRVMAIDLIGTGVYFTLLLLGLLWVFRNLNGTERGVFFTAFIMLQFWNLFLAKHFKADASLTALLPFSGRGGHANSFWTIAAIIFFGQVAIVSVAYNFFNISRLPADITGIVILCAFLALLPKLLVVMLHRLFRAKAV